LTRWSAHLLARWLCLLYSLLVPNLLRETCNPACLCLCGFRFSLWRMLWRTKWRARLTSRYYILWRHDQYVQFSRRLYTFILSRVAISQLDSVPTSW
jgi:hypothetical protein